MSDELDPRLKDLYGRIPKDEPSGNVDAAILKAAGQPVSIPRKQDWLLSFGAVASVVMVSTLAVYLQTSTPDALQKAVSVQPQVVPTAAPSPVAEPAIPMDQARQLADSAASPKAVESGNTLAEEQAMASRRSAELARLRAEFAAKGGAEHKNEMVPQAPANLPTLRLRPEMDELALREPTGGSSAAGDRHDKLQDAAPMEQRSVMAAPPASAPVVAAKPDMVLGKLKAGGEADSGRMAIASVLIEGVSLGMHRDDLEAMGWGCAQAVCTRQITDPRLPAYWGMPVAGATQRVMFVKDVITVMTLSQVSVAVNNVRMALDRIGKPAEQGCPLVNGERLAGRQAGNMVLGLWQDGELTVLGVCQAK